MVCDQMCENQFLHDQWKTCIIYNIPYKFVKISNAIISNIMLSRIHICWMVWDTTWVRKGSLKGLDGIPVGRSYGQGRGRLWDQLSNVYMQMLWGRDLFKLVTGLPLDLPPQVTQDVTLIPFIYFAIFQQEHFSKTGPVL